MNGMMFVMEGGKTKLTTTAYISEVPFCWVAKTRKHWSPLLL